MNRRLAATLSIATLSIALVTAAGPVVSQEIKRNRIPGSNFPISQSVEVPAGAEFLFLSGQVPPVVNQGAAPGSIAAYGNITTQTVGVIRQMQRALEAQGWSLRDVVMMRVYMAPDPFFGFGMNFRGFMEGYTQFFGTANQPILPARSVVQVSKLVAPGWLIEIDAMASRVAKTPYLFQRSLQHCDKLCLPVAVYYHNLPGSFHSQSWLSPSLFYISLRL